MKQGILFIILSLLIVSCSYLVESMEAENYEVIGSGDKPLSLVFSHNINGETHPCGCRHFPLGGLPQVAGQMEKIKQKSHMLYVDTGDTFFPSSKVPESLRISLTFAAKNIAKAMDEIGLRYFVPGDQDFAAGFDFLKEVALGHKFQFLISNLASNVELKHQSWAEVKNGNYRIFLLGFVNPEAIQPEFRKLFVPVNAALESSINLLKQNGYDETDKTQRLIVLSHAGINFDEKMAARFPSIDWIIGSHTQSFFRYSRDIGQVKIAQVLSRNHYLGEITIGNEDRYVVHEIRDEMKDMLKPNPWLAFIDAHKEKMKELQSKEQSAMVIHDDNAQKKYITALSCVECHKSQGDHWRQTPHALAYATLLNTNEYKNLNCVKCHSYGMGEDRGFQNTEDIFVVDEEIKKKEEVKQRFLEAYKKLVKPIESSRKLSSSEIKKYTDGILNLEVKHNIVNNFSAVQCMHCHGMDVEHPFEEEEVRKRTTMVNHASLKNKCLSCHDPDQSPDWYLKNENGLPGKPDWKIVDKHYAEISCPKN